MSSRPTVDQKAYEAAISERERNVVIDAGAGTGKTTALIERFIHLVAPSGESQTHIPITRIAAITFTRRAAGELQFRVRQALLQNLSQKNVPPEREHQLYEALSHIDTAYIGTIHSFCDRLMRLRPVEMNLSPSYEIREDTTELIAETLDHLVRAAQSERLSEYVNDGARAKAAEQTISDYLNADLPLQSKEGDYWFHGGLDSLVKGFIERRDIPPRENEIVVPDLKKTAQLAREVIRRIESLTADSKGQRLFRSLLEPLEGLLGLADPAEALGRMVELTDIKPGNLSKGNDCNGDDATYRLAKDYGWASKDRHCPEILLRDQLAGPLFQWMAARLVRLQPIVVSLYESIKERHQVVDHLDLLLRFRNRIREDTDLREFYQRLFDHILVDEFQDTDPLQMEIMFFLAEKKPGRARSWENVELRPGRITIVGDPKQSIYRFRRADIRSYDQARRMLVEQGALEASLAANFRSRPELIEVFNRRFKEILGEHLPGTSPVDAQSGQSLYDPLAASGKVSKSNAPCVLGLPYTGFKGKAEGLQVEAEMLVRYLRWMVESNKVEVRDPTENKQRAVRYEDITILVRSTYHVPVLLETFRRYDVAYTARGGFLFLSEPLVQSFILGLRALADPEDGVAQAALFRPPFFAIDYSGLLAASCEGSQLSQAGKNVEEAAARARTTRQWVNDLSRHRNSRPPSATALDLLEQSGFGRAASLMPNGPLTLSMIREIVLEMDLHSAREGVDFDGVTQALRKWIDDPTQLDPPDPVEGSLVRVLSIHQAKGLEFPIVALWDGFDSISEGRDSQAAWHISHDGESWSINLHPLKASFPPSTSAFEQEKIYAHEERKRLYYVAATRARDFLILPLPDAPKGSPATSQIAESLPSQFIRFEPVYSRAQPAAWSKTIVPAPPFRELTRAKEFDDLLEQSRTRWGEALKESSRPIAEPLAVTRAIHEIAPIREEEDRLSDHEDALRGKNRESRLGLEFGRLVHEVLAAVVSGSKASVKQLAQAAATRLPAFHAIDEAMGDVERAITALQTNRILGAGLQTQTEYPVVKADGKGGLLVGFVDLVALSDNEIWVIDYKTDKPSDEVAVSSYPLYVEQLRTYAEMLDAAGVVRQRRVRRGLLFTANGQLLEV
jgi:ATP-dependent exoDNAse (exonuclease V) beta subunit